MFSQLVVNGAQIPDRNGGELPQQKKSRCMFSKGNPVIVDV